MSKSKKKKNREIPEKLKAEPMTFKEMADTQKRFLSISHNKMMDKIKNARIDNYNNMTPEEKEEAKTKTKEKFLQYYSKYYEDLKLLYGEDIDPLLFIQSDMDRYRYVMDNYEGLVELIKVSKLLNKENEKKMKKEIYDYHSLVADTRLTLHCNDELATDEWKLETIERSVMLPSKPFDADKEYKALDEEWNKINSSEKE